MRLTPLIACTPVLRTEDEPIKNSFDLCKLLQVTNLQPTYVCVSKTKNAILIFFVQLATTQPPSRLHQHRGTDG